MSSPHAPLITFFNLEFLHTHRLIGKIALAMVIQTLKIYTFNGQPAESSYESIKQGTKILVHNLG